MRPKKKKKIWEPMPAYKTSDPSHLIGSIKFGKTTIPKLKKIKC
jgi:hypothetical protein